MNYYKSLLDFRNKIVFVIGGSGLIGKEVIKGFISNKAKVINFDFSLSNNKRKNLFSQKLDLKNIENSIKVIKDSIKKYGTPAVFINCSYPKTHDWAENNFKSLSIKSYKENIDIHLNSYVLISRLIAEKMSIKKKGSIVLFGSIYGVVGQDLSVYKNTKMTENLTYSVIKGGISNYTRQMASYYGKNNIRVNCICPGGVLDKFNSKNRKFIKNYINKVPLKRLANKKEIAASTLFLSSKAASYITGSTLLVDGGWTAI